MAGANLTYSITLTNNGPNAAQSVTLTDAVPANTTFISFTSPAGWVNTAETAGCLPSVVCPLPLRLSANSGFRASDPQSPTWKRTLIGAV